MNKLIIASLLLISFCSCGASSSDNNNTTTDGAGLTNPTAIDTTKHPSGMDNSSVISTDTAAMNVQNSYKKIDSARKKE
jgi:hypothetical protein